MARTFENFTDIPTAEIKRIYEAVCPAGLRAHDVAIKNCARQFRGCAYSDGSGFHASARPFVVVSIARTDDKARVRMTSRHRPGYLPMCFGSRREALVAVLAHELRHLWQSNTGRRRSGMVYGSKGKMSERDADAYALQMLRRYRRGELL